MKKTIIEYLNNIIEMENELYEIEKQNETLLKLIDKKENSNYYFNIINFRNIDGILEFELDRKPQSRSSKKNYKDWIDASTLNEKFKYWLRNLKHHNNSKF